MTAPGSTPQEMLDDLFARIRAITGPGSGGGAILTEIPERPGVFRSAPSGGLTEVPGRPGVFQIT